MPSVLLLLLLWCCCCTLCNHPSLNAWDVQEEEDQQRAEIFEKKREKEGMLARKAANITSIRRIAAAQATARRQLSKEQQAVACHQVESAFAASPASHACQPPICSISCMSTPICSISCMCHKESGKLHEYYTITQQHN